MHLALDFECLSNSLMSSLLGNVLGVDEGMVGDGSEDCLSLSSMVELLGSFLAEELVCLSLSPMVDQMLLVGSFLAEELTASVLQGVVSSST